MPYFLCSGLSATTICMVEQFGLAIILSAAVSTCAFTSGTTSFFVLSILQADELSMTVVPTSANLGAHSSEVLPPAENKAISGFFAIASVMVTTLYLLPRNVTSIPFDLSEATGINSSTGKLRSSSTFIIVLPTKPVAPTTATFISVLKLELQKYYIVRTGNRLF